MPIRQLAPDVAAKIAAGEVVERPASVVKELIENSIDAGATQIRIDLASGGLQLIRVIDNGSGIPVDELPLALARHATSKVAQIGDLDHIRSLGFRGEALASIAAVAEVTLLSRHRDASQGAQVSACNGETSAISTAAAPEGTMLTVRNLFSSVPARLKFLKSRNTEISHCHHLLEQYALAYPEIRFSVFSEGRQILATPGDGQLTSVLLEIYGLQVAEQMIPMSSLDGKDEDSERPVVTGYMSRPTCYKSTRQHMSFFVNRRWVMSRMLSYAVEEAYHSLLLAGRHPLAVVNIQIDPTLIDVNVHPAKTEIRFLRERRVYSAVQRAIRSGLLEGAEVPEWGQGNVGGHAIAPPSPLDEGNQSSTFRASDEQMPTEIDAAIEDDFPMPEEENSGQEHHEAGFQGVINQEVGHQGVINHAPTLPLDNPWITVAEEETGTKPPLSSRLWQSHVRRSERVELPDVAPAASMADSDDTPDKNGVAPLAGTIVARAMLPHLRVIGQLSQSYIVAEGPDGMYLVDQHAAHERILLERMVAALQASAPLSQLLLTPINLQLAPTELEAIEEHKPQLAHIGFSLEIAENSTVQVQAVPNVLVKQLNARSVHELLAELTAPEHLGHTETWEEHALANVACKAAIKANYFLATSEMREMIEQLAQTNAPYSCCHGRPTMVHFSLSTLEREFGRR